MKSAALTLKVWAAYVVLTAIGLLLAPNLLLGPLGFAPTQEIWVHVAGLIAAVLGYYYWAGAATGWRDFYMATIFGRCIFFVGCVALVLLAAAPWQVILLGAVDLVGAAWTRIALARR